MEIMFEVDSKEIIPFLECEIFNKEISIEEFYKDIKDHDGVTHATKYRNGEILSSYTVFRNIGVPWYVGFGYFFVTLEQQHHGYGKYIFTKFCEKFKSTGIIVNSIIGPSFYEPFGFKILGPNQTLEGLRDNAVVMIRHPDNDFFKYVDESKISSIVPYV